MVVDRKDRIFTWGFGGYGRLGHDENKDELVPRLLKFFDGPNRGAVMIAAGSTFSMAVNKLGQHVSSFIFYLTVRGVVSRTDVRLTVKRSYGFGCWSFQVQVMTPDIMCSAAAKGSHAV